MGVKNHQTRETGICSTDLWMLVHFERQKIISIKKTLYLRIPTFFIWNIEEKTFKTRWYHPVDKRTWTKSDKKSDVKGKMQIASIFFFIRVLIIPYGIPVFTIEKT